MNRLYLLVVKLIFNRFKASLPPVWVAFYLGFYLFTALLLWRLFYADQINPDATAYADIAKLYTEGRFSEALNGYWSPLYSWIASLFWGLSPEKSIWPFKFISIVSGVFLLGNFHWALSQKGITIANRVLALLTLSPLTIYFSLAITSPDLLFTAILGVVSWVLHQEKNNANALFVGFFAALCYFAKAYGMPLLISLLIVAMVWVILKKDRKALRFYGSVLFFAALFVAPYVLLISQKYGYPTFSLAGAFNYALTGEHCAGYPTIFRDYQPPNIQGVTSIWQDPSQLDIENWSMFASPDRFVYQLVYIIKNTATLTRIVLVYGLASAPVVFFWALRCLKRKNAGEVFLLAALIVYCGGLLLFQLEDRYLLPVFVMIHYFGWVLLSPTNKEVEGGRSRSSLILTPLLILSLSSTPIYKLAQKTGIDKDTRETVSVLKSKIPKDSKICANDNWAGALHLCYFLDLQFCGLLPSKSVRRVEGKYQQSDFIFYWKSRPDKRPTFDDECWKLVEIPNLSGWQVYRNNCKAFKN